MAQHTVKQAAEPMAPETKPPGGAMAMCPMVKMCAGITQKRPSGLLLMLPGVVLIVVGGLIAINPRVADGGGIRSSGHHAVDDGQLHPQS